MDTRLRCAGLGTAHVRHAHQRRGAGLDRKGDGFRSGVLLCSG